MPFPGFAERVSAVRGKIEAARERGGHGQTVTLIAVTKTYGPEAVQAAWDAGIADVGENRVQEATGKQEQVTVPVHWHLIGHLQRNKAKAASRFHLVHSVDNERLAQVLQDVAAKEQQPLRVLVQVNVSGEETKGGFERDTWATAARNLRAFDALRVEGIMTMAPFDASDDVLRTTFRGARDARATFAEAGHPATELSMGMSNDFEIAVEEGATMVRLGTILFGARAQ